MLPSKADIKLIRSLSEKKFREKNSLFVIEGKKLVQEAISSKYIIEKVFYTKDIGEELMSKMTLLSSPSPALAVVRIPKREESISIDENSLYIALDAIRDPGNMGTIIRLADWFGVAGIFASEDCVDIYNPKVIQATMGSIFRVGFSYVDLKKLLVRASESICIFGTYLEGENIYSSTFPIGALIIMGSESRGISSELAPYISNKIHIPSFAEAGRGSESLNVAVATAIVCSEFRRR